jgi:thioredoxin-like negative regulator of GroEL
MVRFFTRQDLLQHVSNISSFDPAAESNCEELLKTALQVDPENAEALQMLASVRMSQQRPDEAKEILEKAWSSWKDLEAGGFSILPLLESHLSPSP